ncbi:MAG: DNA polymerase III subunit gamma/tau [Mariprofundaceae bacterium]|nr:DNA polymerase III subunit gamma/tau [Mariprofundaceae bacterium]
MSYLVLARRWRPKQFSDLVGQGVVVRTLQNALAGQSLAHAYLLTGIRGVGKTTIARLMAMAVNCAQARGGEPCARCDACLSIMQGNNLDVQEMDAASHTGVDDVREILDGVRYPPVSLKYRVYIIDEAHMLSKSAFNALLKTLEEPPAHVLFILATTEVEKLPVTVRSRCQRFDLRRLGTDEISAYLGSVLSQEHVEAELPALHAIARAADGSVRDALSLTERVLAYSGERIRAGDVQQALGLIGSELVRTLADAVFENEPVLAVEQLRRAINAGNTPRALLVSLGELIHQLSCVKVSGALLQDEADEHERQWLQAWSGRWSFQDLDLRYQALLHGLRDLAMVDEQRGTEMVLMRLCHLNAISGPSGVSAGAVESIGLPPAADQQPEEPDRELQPAADIAEAAASREAGEDLPLHSPDEPPGEHFSDWAAALQAYHEIKPGMAAMLEHVGILEFGSKIRLALDRHQQNAIVMPDRLAFQEWIGRDVFWEAAQETPAESLSQNRARQAESEKRRLWEQAENDPHLKAMVEKMGLRITNVRPPGVGPEGQQD